MNLAAAISPPKMVNVNELLTKAKLQDVSYERHLEQTLIEKMAAETVTATAQGRKAFLHVDLTSREVLPLWLSPEAVGPFRGCPVASSCWRCQ